MPKLGLGLSLPQTRAASGFTPKKLSGLSLWLKADAGLNTAPQTFISQIVVSGAGTADSNGTYTRTSGGTSTFYKNGTPGGNNIYFEDGYESSGLNFYLYDYQNDAITYIITIKKSEIIDSSIAGGDAPLPTFTTTLTATGNYEVNTWADQSGNGNNATARTGNATLVSSVINGNPVLRFDGTANLITNNFFAHNWNTPITIIAVSKASASTVRGEQPTARYISGVTNSGGYEAGLGYGAYGTENPNFSNFLGISYASSLDIQSSAMGENEKRIASTINSGSQISFFLDGTLIGTADPANQSGGSNSTGAFSIGSDVVLDEIDNFFCVCDIAEIIIYNRAITTPERQQVEAYLVNKYGIQLPNINNMFLPQLWLKADAGVTLSGSNVTAWVDQSGNGNNASANSGEEPTFVSSFLNEKPAIEFNGQGQIIQIADANNLAFLNTSCFIVLKYLGDGIGNNVIYIKNANDGSPADPAVYGMVGTLGLFNGNLDWPVSSAAQAWPDLDSYINITDGTPRLLSMTYDGTDIITYDAGVQTSSNELGGNMLTSTGLLQIGGFNQSFGVSEYFNGQIAEIIMYNRAVSSTERQQVEAYLGNKYAIALCSDVTANVLMEGWYAGPRTLTRQSENLYEYGNETLFRADNETPWSYANDGSPFVTSLTVAPFPWLASWPSPYTATKVCPA